MATIKSYTDIEQSRKLAEILPIESADFQSKTIESNADGNVDDVSYVIQPCWSLSALLSVLPKTINHETLFIETSPVLWHIGYRNVYTARTDNPVDACYELILKLHELNLL